MPGNHRSERGQALVLIVIGIIGLVGITALSIDGGNAYFDRRRAQNAADTAAMAAGLAKVRQLPSVSPADAWKGWFNRACNGYEQSTNRSVWSISVTKQVLLGAVRGCSQPVCSGEITSTVVLVCACGWDQQITNRVEAVPRR
jgi:Tfp pilus assembly protein PilV